MENQYQHLTMTQRNEQLKLLQKIEDFFDRTFGTWKTDPIGFELKENAKPICSRPYPVVTLHKEMFKTEVDGLVLHGLLRVASDSEWGAPSFAQPKPKSNRIRFLSDIRNLNKQLKQKPYPIPKTNEMLLKLEGFNYAASLDLNMGYYHVVISENAGNLCTIIIPLGKYGYKRLRTGVSNSADIFQKKMNGLFHGFEFIRACIDDLSILTKGNCKYHIQNI